MAVLPIVLSAYALAFALPILLPGRRSLLAYCAVAAVLFAWASWTVYGQRHVPASWINVAGLFLLGAATLSGVLARPILPGRGEGKPVRRFAVLAFGLALPFILLAVLLFAGEALGKVSRPT